MRNLSELSSPEAAAVFAGMSKEESRLRRRLIELYQKRFGEFIPIIRRNRYMDTPLLRAAFQVVVGGVLVFFTGILIGGAG